MLREEIKAGVASIEIQANGGVSLDQMVAAKVQRLKVHLEAAFALPSATHEESRQKRIAIKKAALAIADSCDVVVSDAYGVEEETRTWSDIAKEAMALEPIPGTPHVNESILNG